MSNELTPDLREHLEFWTQIQDVLSLNHLYQQTKLIAIIVFLGI